VAPVIAVLDAPRLAQVERDALLRVGSLSRE
jgi:hypothetical protein